MCPEVLNWRHLDRPLHGLRLQIGQDGMTPASPLQVAPEWPLRLWRNSREPRLLERLWEKTDEGKRYRSRLEIHRTQSGLLLKIDCEGKGSFEYRPEGIGVHWQKGGTEADHYFQTLGAALWLELKGVPCIHANALDTGEGAIGLVAPSRTGKSTLTGALLDAGLAVMTDDMMALHPHREGWRVHPAWPRLRLWPDTVQLLFRRLPEELERVHRRFDKRVLELEPTHGRRVGPRPLKGFYLLERRGERQGEIRITRLSAGEAMVHLLQNSMLADAYRPLKLEAGRLKRLAAVAESVPFRRISYPSGLEHLPTVVQAILGRERGAARND